MDTILIFAKETEPEAPNYINIESPTKDPTTYGTPVTDLTTLEKGLAFISANIDHVDSSSQSYLGSDITGLDMEIRYNNLTLPSIGTFVTLISQHLHIIVTDTNFYVDFVNVSGALSLNIKIADNIINTSLVNIPTDGVIQINSDGIVINVLLNGIVINTQVVNDTNLSNLTGVLYFAAYLIGSVVWGGIDGSLSYVKLNEHIWGFTEGTGTTTTNSEGVVSTLNSTVSIAAMWYGSIASDIQYEFDSLAMLIYNGTGSTVSFIGRENQHYIFAAFNIINNEYSNPIYSTAQTRTVHPLDWMMAKSDRIQWASPGGYPCGTDEIMIVVSTSAITINPSGASSGYTTGVDTDYAVSTSYLNGVDDTDGKVLFMAANSVDRTVVSNLPLDSYVNIYVNRSTDWSLPVGKLINIR